MCTLPIEAVLSMHSEELYLARVLFKNKVYASDGSAYETLFTQVMTLSHPKFTQIKPQGKVGDRKNDGYEPDTGHYYQVYAPENPDAKSTQTKAVKKASDDFAGLLKYWNSITPVKRYSFTYNDKYKGSFAEIEKTVADIKKVHGLEECCTLLASHLEDKLFKLKDAEIVAVVGIIPDPDNIESLDYSLLNEVIAAIRAADSNLTSLSVLSAPDFQEKISFNGLSEGPATLLRVASYQNGAVNDFFKTNSAFAKQEIRDELNRLYQAAKADVAKETVTNGIVPADLVFFSLLDRITPVKNNSMQGSSLVLMAYFFESCDIFEDPSNGGAANVAS
jgi:C-terminal domain 10 of the ABC-three component (ABC-3C) systems